MPDTRDRIDILWLAAGDYALSLSPVRGGSILGFTWCGQPLMRPVCGPSILDVACFPLAPFSNRVAHGRFAWNGDTIVLRPNFPGGVHPHPLHGFGWLSPWRVLSAGACEAVLEHCYKGGDWPWPYIATQRFLLSDCGLRLELALTNCAAKVMPAGLGIHPYFPADASTRYLGRHRGEWHNSYDGLPIRLDERGCARDWWEGEPVRCRTGDTVYTGREGQLLIEWPERDLELAIDCSPGLDFTVVYVPAGMEWFCAEPVTHMTDAFNSDRPDNGIVALAPGETLTVAIHFSARRPRGRSDCHGHNSPRPGNQSLDGAAYHTLGGTTC